MSSTNVVNFSLRTNKSIERAIAFDCFGAVMRSSQIRDAVYVSMGSVWFTDFVLAHRLLGIDTMISVEHDEVVFKRAEFNRPFRTLEVISGWSSQVLPRLLKRDELKDRPWIVWLDYDGALDDPKLAELSMLAEWLPTDSVLVTTFSAQTRKYGEPEERAEVIDELFGPAAPKVADPVDYNTRAGLAAILAEATEDYLVSQAIDAARRGGFVPAIKLMYEDTTPMVTVGGVLPAAEHEEAIRSLVSDPQWIGRQELLIEAPHLTPKEVIALQSQLPAVEELTREDVRKLGFDLPDNQLRSYLAHYVRYPQFAQVAR
jgi:Putative O-methyltransferase